MEFFFSTIIFTELENYAQNGLLLNSLLLDIDTSFPLLSHTLSDRVFIMGLAASLFSNKTEFSELFRLINFRFRVRDSCFAKRGEISASYL